MVIYSLIISPHRFTVNCNYYSSSRSFHQNFSFRFSGTHEFFYQLSAPARVYYRLTRWVFGKDYIPFVTSVNEELHPISVFIIDHYEAIRLIFSGFSNIMPMIFVILIIYFILIIKNSQFISSPPRKSCSILEKHVFFEIRIVD